MATVAASALLLPNANTRPAIALTGGVESFRLSARGTLGLWAFGLSMLLICLGSSRVLTYHELGYAQPAKEMLASGDFIVPKIAGVPFVEKPPLAMWLVAVSMFVFQSEAEWVVRLPSVLCSIGTAWLIATLAARWFGSRIGLIAGFVQLTTVHVSMQARLAESDTLLALTVGGAMALFGLSQVESPRGKLTGRWVPWAFYACVAAAFMTKFLAGLAFIIAGCGLFVLVQRDFRAAIRFFVNPIGLLIFVLLTVPWMVAAHLQCSTWLDVVLHHNFGRFGGKMGLNEPAWSYFYQVPAMMLPWSPLALYGIYHAIRRGLFHDPRWQLLACWFAGGMTVLSLSAFKSKHYLIPMLTPLAVIAAVGLLDYLQWRQRVKWKLTWVWALGVTVMLAVATYALPEWLRRSSSAEVGVFKTMVIGVGAALLLILLCEARRLIKWQLIGGFATVWGVSVGIQAGVMPFHNSYGHQTRFAEEVNRRFAEGLDSNQAFHEPTRQERDNTLWMVGLPDNQVTYYLRPQLKRFDEFADFLANVAEQRPKEAAIAILGPEWLEKYFHELGATRVVCRCAETNRYQTSSDRLTLYLWSPAPTLKWDANALRLHNQPPLR